MLITNQKNKPMKKLLLGAAMLLMAQMSFGQAMQEYAIIPISVTLNSVFRLSVVSGGNIEWVVTNIADWNTGIPASTRYQTTFTVAASRDFDVKMYSENATLEGQDNPAVSLALDNVGYKIEATGTGLDGTNWDIPSELTTGTVFPLAIDETIIAGIAGLAAGDGAQNKFVIHWRLGTSEDAMNGASLMEQGLASDRYVTNVFLELIAL